MKNQNKKIKYVFYNVEYPIVNANINFSTLVNNFINDNRDKFGRFISVICQIKNADNNYYTVGDRFPIDLTVVNEISDYVNYLEGKWDVLDKNKYEPKIAISILLNYTTTTQSDYSIKQNKIRLVEYKTDKDFRDYAPLNLPLNNNYLTWGSLSELISSNTYKISNLYSDLNNKVKGYIEVTLLSDIDREIKIYKDSGIKILTFIDKILNKLNGEFNRIVNNTTYHIKNNKLYFIFERLFPKDFITKLKAHKKFDLDILTLDIETYLDNNNKMVIYCISIYDGKKAKSFYLTDYLCIESLIKDLLATIYSRKYSGKDIYIHNSSEFDLIFLLKYIVSYGSTKVNPIIKDGKFINLTISYGKDNEGKYQYELTIRDSLLLLLSSLSKLGKAFNVDIQKDIYPYSFPNKDNLNYKGPVPAYEFFDSKKVSEKEYIDYVKRFKGRKWSLKNETLNYCSIDCISLYQILIKFFNLIFDNFSVNVLNCPTLPSLAFRIFRTKFLSKTIEIPMLKKAIYDNIFKAYFGGHVDMYIPKGPLYPKGDEITVSKVKLLDVPKLIIQKGIDFIKNMFKTVKHYDINSLYPSAMMNYKFPTDIIGYFIGDITLIENYSFLYNENLGIYKVKVNAPDIKHPLLPIRNKNTCLYPTGTWTGWYFSEEIKNCEKYGYQFEILGGYVFKSEYIFTDYIEALNAIKIASEKGSPMYLIAKILMNSLYGRFGLNPFLNTHSFIPNIDFNNFMDKYRGKVVDCVDFGSHHLVSYLPDNNPDNTGIPANVAVALAITSYSRIIMSQFKNRDNITLFYSDTDSLVIDCYLPKEFVDSLWV